MDCAEALFRLREHGYLFSHMFTVLHFWRSMSCLAQKLMSLIMDGAKYYAVIDRFIVRMEGVLGVYAEILPDDVRWCGVNEGPFV